MTPPSMCLMSQVPRFDPAEHTSSIMSHARVCDNKHVVSTCRESSFTRVWKLTPSQRRVLEIYLFNETSVDAPIKIVFGSQFLLRFLLTFLLEMKFLWNFSFSMKILLNVLLLGKLYKYFLEPNSYSISFLSMAILIEIPIEYFFRIELLSECLLFFRARKPS